MFQFCFVPGAKMIDYTSFFSQIANSQLEAFEEHLRRAIESSLASERHGDLKKWLGIMAQLPPLSRDKIELGNSLVKIAGKITTAEQQKLKEMLMELSPWRKGPFELFGLHIDTEWRSDWKWDRFADEIEDLAGKHVLDVGCGSGYHCWRAKGAGADRVVGIEPGLLYATQFYAIKHYMGKTVPVDILPITFEAFPDDTNCFEAVLSMGVLYHRRSPFDHLFKLRSCLKDAGELILETLIIDGKDGEILVPEGRYARMRNVWFIPSCPTLALWLKKSGFRDVRLVDVTQTTPNEQRRTEWMTFESLADFLDPQDIGKTIEGYPAPKRAVFLARK
jgi:tRNA (mo5U34)-methyltransferase